MVEGFLNGYAVYRSYCFNGTYIETFVGWYATLQEAESMTTSLAQGSYRIAAEILAQPETLPGVPTITAVS